MSGQQPAPPAAAPQLSGAAYLRLIIYAALIGIPAALVAALFLAVVYEVEGWLWTDLPDALGASEPPWYLVIGLPVVGAVVVIAARALLPGDGGHRPLLGIGGGVTPLRYGPSIALAAFGTLAFGAVLGPEAPLIALGAVAGITVTTFVKVSETETKVLATAGSFSAVSALFGGPLVAGVLLLEGSVGLGAAAIPALLPGLVAAAVGYVLFVGLGSWGGLNTTSLQVPGLPEYNGTHYLDLALAVVLGIVTAVVIHVVRQIASAVESTSTDPHLPPGAEAAPVSTSRHGIRIGWTGLLLAGGLAVGLLAELARLLGADSQAALFSGQAGVPIVLGETSTSVVLVLLFVKAIAYAVSLGCGFRGGPVFPAIFLGTAIAMLPVLWFDVSPTVALAMGAAAGMAAMTRLLFASILLATLLVGTAGLDAVPAAVIAASTAWVAIRVLASRTAGGPQETPPAVAH